MFSLIVYFIYVLYYSFFTLLIYAYAIAIFYSAFIFISLFNLQLQVKFSEN